MTQNDDHGDDNTRGGCARGTVRLLQGVTGHYELRIQQTTSPVHPGPDDSEATICMTAGELRGLQKMIEAMFPSPPEMVSLDLSARRDQDSPHYEPTIEVG